MGCDFQRFSADANHAIARVDLGVIVSDDNSGDGVLLPTTNHIPPIDRPPSTRRSPGFVRARLCLCADSRPSTSPFVHLFLPISGILCLHSQIQTQIHTICEIHEYKQQDAIRDDPPTGRKHAKSGLASEKAQGISSVCCYDDEHLSYFTKSHLLSLSFCS